eukprot:197544-Pleurochrysis_carterae.AAC.1
MVTPSGPLAGSHLTTTVDAPSSASDASFRKAESSALARCEGPAAARHTAELMYVPTTEAEISYVHRTTECEQRARRVSRSTPKLCSLLFACKSTFDNKTRLISQSLRQPKRLILCTMSPGPAKWDCGAAGAGSLGLEEPERDGSAEWSGGAAPAGEAAPLRSPPRRRFK